MIVTLAEHGVPCGVSLAPQIPFLNDDMEQVLEAAWEAGAREAFYHVIRLPWEVAPGDGGFPAGAALTFVASQIEAGHFCPISMACAAVPTLRMQPEVAHNPFWTIADDGSVHL